jgi:hypothetical protein
MDLEPEISQADPLGLLDSAKKQRERGIEECVNAMAAYNAVRDMALLPAWETFILELHKRAKNQREVLEDAIDNLLLNRAPESEEAFIQAKVMLLALEEAVQIYIKLRERAHQAKDLLDKISVKGEESTQNGPGAAIRPTPGQDEI